MSSYHTYHQISKSPAYSYKLVQLPPDILEYMRSSPNNDLLIKAPTHTNNELVMCTQDSTWKLRQMNHSNTVLVLNNMNVNKLNHQLKHVVPSDKNKAINNKLLGLTNCSFEYELLKSQGYIEISNLPSYNGSPLNVPSNEMVSVTKLINDSPISLNQFYKEWYSNRGCEINGQAVLLLTQFTTEVLQTLIPILISNQISYTEGSFNIELNQIVSLMHNQNDTYNKEIVLTILHKFGFRNPDSPTSFKLNNLEISKWFGIQTLLSSASATSIQPKQLLINWKSSFPPFYNIPIDLKDLRGYYCRPLKDQIQYLDPSVLTDKDISARAKDLFKVVKEWDYDEFLPFIQHLIPSGKKTDSVILKFARKKRVGKNKFMVTPR